MSPEERLKEVEAEIASIREDLSKPKVKELPVGSVIAGLRATAQRVGSVHTSVRHYPCSTVPTWVTTWGDASGSSHKTLEKLLDAHMVEFANYKILRLGYS